MDNNRLIFAEDCKDLMYAMCAGQDKAFQAAMEQVIDDCPTADAEPIENHAHWVIFDKRGPCRVYCSHCDQIVSLYGCARPKHCPKCDAKMDEQVRQIYDLEV